VKCMHFRAAKADCVFKGDYLLNDDEVHPKVFYFMYLDPVTFDFHFFMFFITFVR
jgi:hypothetical protein